MWLLARPPEPHSLCLRRSAHRSHETLRQWGRKFGQAFANQIRRRLPRAGNKAQRFLSAHDGINNLFHLRRDHLTASEYRAARVQAFQVWSDIGGVAVRA